MTLLASSLGEGLGWTKIYDIDFTNSGNITLNSDGAYNINGVNWYKLGSANQTGNVTINSSGLTIPAKASGPSFTFPPSTAFTCPTLLMYPFDICPAIKGVNAKYNIGIRLWVYNSSISPISSNAQMAIGGISTCNTSDSTYGGHSWYFRRGITSSQIIQYVKWNGKYSDTGALSESISANNSVIVTETMNLHEFKSVTYVGSMNGNLWPSFNNLKQGDPRNSTATIFFSDFTNSFIDNLFVFLSTTCTSATPTTAIFNRLRIDIHL